MGSEFDVSCMQGIELRGNGKEFGVEAEDDPSTGAQDKDFDVRCA